MDEFERIAKEIMSSQIIGGCTTCDVHFLKSDIEKVIVKISTVLRKAVEAEREACLKIAEDAVIRQSPSHYAESIANAIRGRTKND